MKNFFKNLILATLAAISLANFASVDTATNSDNVILAGHDAVAYFTVGKPTLGIADYSVEHKGATYLFSSVENRDLFKANPNKYEPAYGGYCAYGTTFGKKFDVDGKAFEVVNGQLYVNKNLDVYKAWKKDVPGNIVQADVQWPIIKDVPASDL